MGDNQQTVDCALRAVSLLHRLPLSHFNLGVALVRSEENERAVLAFETALRFQPKMVNAHRYLATIHRREGGDEAKGMFHREEILRLSQRRRRPSSAANRMADQLFDLPEIPKRSERGATLLRERPDPKPEEEPSGKTFVLVSGLPRSGTSLMMQLLEAGGLPVMTDAQRAADIDNPCGYYEWEAIKQVVAYQEAMRTRLGTRGAELDQEQLARGLRAHREEMRRWGRNAPHCEWLEIDYPTLVREPKSVIAGLVEFLGSELLPNESGMSAAVDPALHRRKA